MVVPLRSYFYTTRADVMTDVRRLMWSASKRGEAELLLDPWWLDQGVEVQLQTTRWEAMLPDLRMVYAMVDGELQAAILLFYSHDLMETQAHFWCRRDVDRKRVFMWARQLGSDFFSPLAGSVAYIPLKRRFARRLALEAGFENVSGTKFQWSHPYGRRRWIKTP